MKFINIFKNSFLLLDLEQNIQALKILDVIKLQNLILKIFNNNVQQHMIITRENIIYLQFDNIKRIIKQSIWIVIKKTN